MQLPDFIKRMVSFADKAEANLAAATELATAHTRIVTLETEVATLKASSSAFEVQITNLTGDLVAVRKDLDTAKAAVTAKESELEAVRKDLVTAKGTANAVIASQGLSAETLPPLDPRASGSEDESTLDLTERCLRAKAASTRN